MEKRNWSPKFVKFSILIQGFPHAQMDDKVLLLKLVLGTIVAM